MIYSVWRDGAYDYYETSSSADDKENPRPKFLAMRKSSDVGVAVENAAWPLPAGATLTGRGAKARGMIAAPSNGGAALGEFVLSPSNPLLLLALAGLGWWWFKR